jgi:hypothetical protein
MSKTIFQKRPKSMVAINKKLWASCQTWAKRTYDVHPSAYSNSAAVKRYNKMGGKWRKPSRQMEKKAMEVKFDVKESDIMPPFNMDEAKLLAERMGIDFEELDTTAAEFLKGLNTELEHRFLTHGDPSDTALIAVDHLREDPEYYSKLIEMEADAPKKEDEDDAPPTSLDDEMQLIADFFGVEHHDAVNHLYDMLESPTDSNVKIAKPLGGLGYWHKKEKWVDISRKDKSGKHPPCGRSDSSKGGKPRCRPASEAAKLSAAEKKTETQKKRRTEQSKTRKDKKPHMVKFDYMKKSKKKAEADMNFQKIATDLTGLAAGIESRGNAQAAKAVDELTIRLLSLAEQLPTGFPTEDPEMSQPSTAGAAATGVRLNDGHNITTYSSADEILNDLTAKRLTAKQVVAAVADTLYASGLVDAQANLAVASDKLPAALRIAKSAGLLR